nr:LysE family transporter [Arthrobacter roseus]
MTGVAAMLEQFPGIRTGLTWIGGSYLMLLGGAALYQVRRSRKAAAPAAVLVPAGGVPADPLDEGPQVAAANNTRANASSVFRTGLISSLTNPKTGLFFLALMPPFLPDSPSLIDHGLLVATAAGCILIYGAFLSAVADRVGGLLTAGSGPAIIDTTAGAVLVLLGITVLLMP